MSHAKIQGVGKSERARRGRKWQYIGAKKVPKYAYSPYTATSEHTFYADTRLRIQIVSPTAGQSNYETKYITVRVIRGTFRDFKVFVESGEAMERILAVVGAYGGEVEAVEGYWRSKNGYEIPDE